MIADPARPLGGDDTLTTPRPASSRFAPGSSRKEHVRGVEGRVGELHALPLAPWREKRGISLNGLRAGGRRSRAARSASRGANARPWTPAKNSGSRRPSALRRARGRAPPNRCSMERRAARGRLARLALEEKSSRSRRSAGSGRRGSSAGSSSRARSVPRCRGPRRPRTAKESGPKILRVPNERESFSRDEPHRERRSSGCRMRRRCWQRFARLLVFLAISLWGDAADVDRRRGAPAGDPRDGKKPLHAIWHQRMVGGILAHRGEGYVTMASKSEDGEIIATFLELWGFRAARGLLLARRRRRHSAEFLEALGRARRRPHSRRAARPGAEMQARDPRARRAGRMARPAFVLVLEPPEVPEFVGPLPRARSRSRGASWSSASRSNARPARPSRSSSRARTPRSTPRRPRPTGCAVSRTLPAGKGEGEA